MKIQSNSPTLKPQPPAPPKEKLNLVKNLCDSFELGSPDLRRLGAYTGALGGCALGAGLSTPALAALGAVSGFAIGAAVVGCAAYALGRTLDLMEDRRNWQRFE